MTNLVIHHPMVHLYLIFVGALLIAVICGRGGGNWDTRHGETKILPSGVATVLPGGPGNRAGCGSPSVSGTDPSQYWCAAVSPLAATRPGPLCFAVDVCYSHDIALEDLR
jgi:hypothetical protein